MPFAWFVCGMNLFSLFEFLAMAEELIGNCLVAQSGGPTAVINASVAGVVSEALNHPCIEEIYGGMNGVLGILKEDLIDLAEESQQNIRGLRYTPASALGTCRFKLKRDQDYERVLEVFEAHNIRYFFYAVSGTFTGMDNDASLALFQTFTADAGQVVLWHTLFIGINVGIVIWGLHAGIEKAVTVLMPLPILCLSMI